MIEDEARTKHEQNAQLIEKATQNVADNATAEAASEAAKKNKDNPLAIPKIVAAISLLTFAVKVFGEYA